MKKYIVVFCVVLVWIGGFSCKKYENTTISVTVYDEVTNQKVANVGIGLYELKKKTSIDLLSWEQKYESTLMKIAYTDANGHCDFGNFETHKENKFDYILYPKSYYGQIFPDVMPKVGDSFDALKKGEHNERTIAISGAKTRLIVKYLPAPPYNTGDSLTMSIHNSIMWFCGLKVTIHNYLNFQTPNTLCAGLQYINIDKYKSGVYTNIKDTIFYQSDSTYEYDVNW